MPLRWTLLGLGALFIAGLALWEWRRARRRFAQSAPEVAVPVAVTQPRANEGVRRLEPRIDGLGAAEGISATDPVVREVPVIHPNEQAREPVAVPVARETAVDMPAAVSRPAQKNKASALRWPPERADRVLTLRLVKADGAQLSGHEVRLTLEQAGMVHGPQNIFHMADAHGAVMASAANMLRPGDLLLHELDEQQLRGLSLFSVLPGPLPAVRMLEELVALARSIAWRLGAVVQDEHGAELTGDVLLKLRQSLPDGAENPT